MSYSISWMPEAIATFNERIEYLKLHWTEHEVVNFNKRVKNYLEILRSEPFIGKKGRLKNVHIGLIIKEVSLVYRIQISRNEIELISFVDNRQNPKKIKKYKA